MTFHKIWKPLTAIIVFCLLALGLPRSSTAEPEGDLIMYHAGSLSVPFAKMEKVFEARYPKIDLVRTAGGSTKMARMISEKKKPADIMGSGRFCGY